MRESTTLLVSSFRKRLKEVQEDTCRERAQSTLRQRSKDFQKRGLAKVTHHVALNRLGTADSELCCLQINMTICDLSLTKPQLSPSDLDCFFTYRTFKDYIVKERFTEMS